MYLPEEGKQSSRLLGTTSDAGHLHSRSCLFFLTDKDSKTCFLVDSGVEYLELPPFPHDRGKRQPSKLDAAGGTTIPTCGLRAITINLGLRYIFQWVFIVGDTQYPILGAYFLQKFNLLVNVRGHRPYDATTHLAVSGVRTKLQSTYPFQCRLSIRQCSSTLSILVSSLHFTIPVQHKIQHHIEETGPVVNAQPRRIPPDK